MIHILYIYMYLSVYTYIHTYIHIYILYMCTYIRIKLHALYQCVLHTYLQPSFSKTTLQAENFNTKESVSPTIHHKMPQSGFQGNPPKVISVIIL